MHQNDWPRSLKLVAFGTSTSHWHVYGEVPPLNEVVVLSVELPPTVTFPLRALISGTVSGGSTVTVTLAQELTAGVPGLLSVTSTE
jgi:hypothetical protein